MRQTETANEPVEQQDEAFLAACRTLTLPMDAGTKQIEVAWQKLREAHPYLEHPERFIAGRAAYHELIGRKVDASTKLAAKLDAHCQQLVRERQAAADVAGYRETYGKLARGGLVHGQLAELGAQLCLEIGRLLLDRGQAQDARDWYLKAIRHGPLPKREHLALLHELLDRPAPRHAPLLLDALRGVDMYYPEAEDQRLLAALQPILTPQPGQLVPDVHRDRLLAWNRLVVDLTHAAPWAYENLARLLVDAGQAEDAIEVLTEALSVGLISGQIYALLGQAYARLGDSKQAARCFEEATTCEPDNLLLRIECIDATMREAEALRFDPTGAPVLDSQTFDSLGAHLDPFLQQGNGDLPAGALFALGCRCVLAGETEEATRRLIAALAGDGAPASARLLLTYLLLEAGNGQAARGQMLEWRRDPGPEIGGWYLLWKVASRKEEPDIVLEAIERWSAGVDPQVFGELGIAMASSCLSIGRPEQALGLLDRLPENQDLLALRLRCLLRLGRTDQAGAVLAELEQWVSDPDILWVTGRYHALRGELDLAREALAQAGQRGSPAALFDLARLELGTGSTGAARAVLEQAPPALSASGEGRLVLADCLALDGQRDAAIEAYRALIEDGHESWRLCYNLAMQLDPELAGREAGVLIVRGASDPAAPGEVLLAVGRVLLGRGELQGARRYLELSLNDAGGSTAAHELLARTALLEGDPDSAISRLEAVASSSSLSPGIESCLNVARQLAAYRAIRRADYSTALKHLKQCYAVRRAAGEDRTNLAELYFRMGVQQVTLAGKPDAAGKAFDQAIRLCPDRLVYRYQRLLLDLEQQPIPADTERRMARLAGQDPDSQRADLLRVLFHLARGEMQQVERMVDGLRQLDAPARFHLQRRLALHYVAQEDWDGARRHFLAISDSPLFRESVADGDSGLAHAFAISLCYSGEIDAALTVLQGLAQRDGGGATSKLMANLEVQRGDVAAAAQIYEGLWSSGERDEETTALYQELLFAQLAGCARAGQLGAMGSVIKQGCETFGGQQWAGLRQAFNLGPAAIAQEEKGPEKAQQIWERSYLKDGNSAALRNLWILAYRVAFACELRGDYAGADRHWPVALARGKELGNSLGFWSQLAGDLDRLQNWWHETLWRFHYQMLAYYALRGGQSLPGRLHAQLKLCRKLTLDQQARGELIGLVDATEDATAKALARQALVQYGDVRTPSFPAPRNSPASLSLVSSPFRHASLYVTLGLSESTPPDAVQRVCDEQEARHADEPERLALIRLARSVLCDAEQRVQHDLFLYQMGLGQVDLFEFCRQHEMLIWPLPALERSSARPAGMAALAAGLGDLSEITVRPLELPPLQLDSRRSPCYGIAR